MCLVILAFGRPEDEKCKITLGCVGRESGASLERKEGGKKGERVEGKRERKGERGRECRDIRNFQSLDETLGSSELPGFNKRDKECELLLSRAVT